MAQMNYTAANIRPLLGHLRQNRVTADECSVGQVVALNNVGQVSPADANASPDYKGIGLIVASFDGETTIPAGHGCTIVTLGPVAGFTSLTPGTLGYVGETSGQIVDVAPSGSAYQWCVGYALNADTFFFMPGFDTGTST